MGDRIVAGAPDAAHAWAALLAAGPLPAAWASDARRRFCHTRATPCPSCGGSGVRYGYGETACYGGCSGGYFYAYSWEPVPESVEDCLVYARDPHAIEQFEQLSFDLFARAAAWRWRSDRADLHPTQARWTVMPDKRTPRVPDALRGTWEALSIAVPDAGLPKPSPVVAMPGWSQMGARAWTTAVTRGLRVPPHVFSVPQTVGRAFAELPDAFAAAAQLEALPCDFFSVDASGLCLWAHRDA